MNIYGNSLGKKANDLVGTAGYNMEENLYSSAEQPNEKGLVSFGKRNGRQTLWNAK